MTYQNDFTLPVELLEQIASEGLDFLPELVRIRMAAQGEGCQLQPRNPPFGALVQRIYVVALQIDPHHPVEEIGALRGGETQLVLVDLQHLPPGAQQVQRQRRVLPAQDHQVQAFGLVFHQEIHLLVDWLDLDHMDIIHDQDQGHP